MSEHAARRESGDLPLAVVCDHVASEGVLLAMSATALRMRLASGTAVPAEGAPVHAGIVLDGEGFVLGGRVLRCEPTERGIELVVALEELSGATRERLQQALQVERIAPLPADGT
jgi:hypothetical protein